MPLSRRSVAVALFVALFAACSPGSPTTVGSTGKLQVIAAENFWGNIASQLGGNKVSVKNIIDNPNADPHDYEPTAADARALAGAQFVIVNGIGYDPWTQRLLDANPVSGREVLNIGNLVGVPVGGNPHQWYSPESVSRLIDAVSAEYEKLDPSNKAYFEQQKSTFLSVRLKDYFGLIATIKSTYTGTPVGASESIFEGMAPALGLRLLTPLSFLKAISEGAEPTARDKATIDHQIQTRAIKAYVYNSQNATPDIQRQVEACRANGIPVTTITETLVPAGASFQQWQVAELRALAATLKKATGR
jgi:zinc/manganese transport system substrate-binding protein